MEQLGYRLVMGAVGFLRPEDIKVAPLTARANLTTLSTCHHGWHEYAVLIPVFVYFKNLYAGEWHTR